IELDPRLARFQTHIRLGREGVRPDGCFRPEGTIRRKERDLEGSARDIRNDPLNPEDALPIAEPHRPGLDVGWLPPAMLPVLMGVERAVGSPHLRIGKYIRPRCGGTP